MDNNNMESKHLSIQDFSNQEEGLQKKLEKLFKSSERKSLTITTIMKVEKALKDLKVRSFRKNYESSMNGEINDTDTSTSVSTVNASGNSYAAHHEENKSRIEITTKRSDSRRYSEHRSRTRTSRRREKNSRRTYRNGDIYTENESSNESISEQTSVERRHYRKNKRDRFESSDYSPYHDRCSPRDRRRSLRYKDYRSPSPRYESRRSHSPRYKDRRYEYSPRYDDRDRSSCNEDRQRSSRYDEKRVSPRYKDRRSRSRTRCESYEKGDKNTKSEGTRNNTRDSSSDSWERADRKIGVLTTSSDNQLLPKNDSKGLLKLTRTINQSTIPQDDGIMEGEPLKHISPQTDEIISNGEPTSQKTGVRSKLYNFLKSHLKINDEPTSTQTSNESSILRSPNRSTNDCSVLDSNVDIKDEIAVDNEIINQIVAQALSTKKNSSVSTDSNYQVPEDEYNHVPKDQYHHVPTEVKFDVGTVKKALPTVEMNENVAVKCNPQVQNQESSLLTRPYCPLSQCISCISTSHIQSVTGYKQSTRKESMLSAPPPYLLSTPQPKRIPTPQPELTSTPKPEFIPIFQPKLFLTPQSKLLPTRQPHLLPTLQTNMLSAPQQILLSTPRPVPLLSLNPNLPFYQPLTSPIQGKKANPFNSTARERAPYLHQASAFPQQQRNSAIVTRRSTTFFDKNRAPLTYGEYKRQRFTTQHQQREAGSMRNYNVTRPSNVAHKGCNSHLFTRSDNSSMSSLPKVIPQSLDMNFKIPKVKDPSKKVHIIEEWDLTPQSVKKQSNSKGNWESPNNVIEKRKDVKELKRCNDTKTQSHENGSNEWKGNGTSDSLLVECPVAEASEEKVQKDVMNSNNLLTLINIMGKLSENNTLVKVKEILQKCEGSSSKQELSENVTANSENTGASKSTKKRHKNELDRLNEDINCMFIRDGVLSANGRRVSPSVKYAESSNEVSDEKQTSESTKMSNTDKSNTIMKVSKSTPLKARKPTKEVVKTGKITAKNTKERKATKTTDSSIKKRIIPSKLLESCKNRKRPRDIAEVEESKPKKAKETFAVQPIVKNNNVEYHSLKKVIDCKLCDKPHGLSLVNHYVNQHSNREVFVSRISPEAAAFLLEPTLIEKCEVVKRPGNGIKKNGLQYTKYEFKQYCYFCNIYKCMGKKWWIHHMAVHTGYYLFRCIDCNRQFSDKPMNHKARHRLERIPQPQFQKPVVNAYVCNLCNFVRFTKCEIQKHLTNEHKDNDNVRKMFKEVLFLSFIKKKKSEEEEDDEESEDYESESEKEHARELEELYKKSLEEGSEEECESEEDYDSSEDHGKEEEWESLDDESDDE